MSGKKVKEKFSSEFNSFNWVHVHSTTDCNEKTLSFQTTMNESFKIAAAIATIVRVCLKRKGIIYLEEQDEEKATNIAKQILEIMKNERRENK